MLILVFASVPGEAGASSWRSVSAPPSTFALAEYVMWAPGSTQGPGAGGEEDTTNTDKIIHEPFVNPTPTQNSTQSLQPPGSIRDTVRTADSIRAFQPAPVETIGPTSFRAAPTASSSAPASVHTRHGVLGLAPIAMLVGLVALHILIVTAVAK